MFFFRFSGYGMMDQSDRKFIFVQKKKLIRYRLLICETTDTNQIYGYLAPVICVFIYRMQAMKTP